MSICECIHVCVYHFYLDLNLLKLIFLEFHITIMHIPCVYMWHYVSLYVYTVHWHCVSTCVYTVHWHFVSICIYTVHSIVCLHVYIQSTWHCASTCVYTVHWHYVSTHVYIQSTDIMCLYMYIQSITLCVYMCIYNSLKLCLHIVYI